MPGIVGIVSRRPAGQCESLVYSMAATMQHESFYKSGAHSAPELGIYAAWVAHENSFAASQAFFNEQQDVALLFSGECFADPEIVSNLREKGHNITTTRDWLVHLYEDEGDRFFEKLNGLFSGLLIDKRQRKTFLFNDRYGLERIYFHERDNDLYFASEAKALLRVLPELRGFDREGVAQFVAFGCTLQTRTLFRGVEMLPGASCWAFENGTCRKRTYFSPKQWEEQSFLSPDEFETQFQETFAEILPKYFESESKIGISLTAGLDSRMIMACLPGTKQPPVCYTFSGQHRDTLDARLAAQVAKACGLEHKTFPVRPDFFSDFRSLVDQTVYLSDGYLGVLGAHEIYFNGRARQLAPVRITGNFGSEILRNVSTFKSRRLSPELINPDVLRDTGDVASALDRNRCNPVSFAAFREIPWKRFGILKAGSSQCAFRTPYLDNRLVGLAYRAPESLRNSPYPALRLVEKNHRGLTQIPTDMGFTIYNRKAPLFRNAFFKATFKLDYLYNDGLPHFLSSLDPFFRGVHLRSGLLGLHKFLHYRTWFQHELANYIVESLEGARTNADCFWNPRFLEHVGIGHTRGRKNYLQEIDIVLTLQAVERLLFTDLPRSINPVPTSIRSVELATAH